MNPLNRRTSGRAPFGPVETILILLIIAVCLVMFFAGKASAAVPDQATESMSSALTEYRAEKQREDLLARLPIGDARDFRDPATMSPITAQLLATTTAANTTGTTYGFQLTREQMAGLIDLYFPEKWHQWALDVSYCESNWYTKADNPHSSAAGLFQFLRDTWNWVSDNTGAPDYDSGGVWEVHWQMVNAAWLVENGGPQHWVCSGLI